MLLRTEELRKTYPGGREALRGVSVHVGPGELVGLLGPNGAGKSTLVKIACGLVAPTSGTVERGFEDPAGGGLGYLAELFRFPDWATADELLAFHQRLARSRGGERERVALLDAVGLGEARELRVGAMSKGMQQRLGIAQALIGEPAFVVLDEPTSALDPAARRLVRDLLVGLRERGTSVLLNSHLLSEVELVCDRVAIIARGELVAQGTPAELSHAGGVQIETDRGTRRWDRATREDAPALVAQLVAAGERVYGVRVLRSSLEDAYLEAVEGHRPAPAAEHAA